AGFGECFPPDVARCREARDENGLRCIRRVTTRLSNAAGGFLESSRLAACARRAEPAGAGNENTGRAWWDTPPECYPRHSGQETVPAARSSVRVPDLQIR